MSRHSDLQNDISDFAREAGFQASTERFAAEIPPYDHEEQRWNTPRRRRARHADVRIEAELGETVTGLMFASPPLAKGGTGMDFRSGVEAS